MYTSKNKLFINQESLLFTKTRYAVQKYIYYLNKLEMKLLTENT